MSGVGEMIRATVPALPSTLVIRRFFKESQWNPQSEMEPWA